MFNIKIKILYIILIVFYHSESVASKPIETTPFWVNADLPVMQGLGLPKALSAQLPIKGDTRLMINGIIKSNANDSGANNETLLIDGESQALELGFEYGLSQQWSVDLQLAYIRHTGGSLDSLIQSWHDAFGLSDGDRPLFDQDNLNFTYRRRDREHQINQTTGGISDARLGLGYALSQLAHKLKPIDSLMLRSGVNLPTGDSDKLTGSDKLDWDIGLYANGHSQKWSKLAWHANFGYLYVGDDSLFGIKTKQHAWFNSLGLSWEISPNLQVKAQLDSHSALFDSEIDELAKYASQLTLGSAYRSKHLGLIEFYVSEDLTVNRAADFSLGLSLKFAL